MRNLLGRLNARSSEDLGEIASHWRAPLTSRDRISQVTALYRTMTRPVMVRARWDALEPRSRDVLEHVLAAGEGGATVGAIATASGLDIADAREALGDLYRAGMIAHEGSAATLPVGATPVVFVPQELATVLNQIRAERERGDISDRRLPELIKMRSDRDLFDAADLWRLDYALGLTSRGEIEQLLLARLANASYRHQAVEALGHDIRTMWDRIQSVPPATAIAVDSLTGQGNDRTWFGRLTALNELEDRLLVWPTVVDGTTRAVFVPAPDHDSGTASGELPKPVVTNFAKPPFRPEAPLAWDLMVLLQRLIGPMAPVDLDPLALTREQGATISRMLWAAADGIDIQPYVDMLIELADSIELIDGTDDGTSRYERTDQVRTWRLGPWSSQSNRLRSAWMVHPAWLEAQVTSGVEPWQVDWQAFRVKLLHHLSALEPGKFYRNGDITAWVASFDPDMLGPRASVAVRASDGTGTTDTARGLRQVVGHTMQTMLAWLGLVDIVQLPAGDYLVATRPELRRVTRATGQADDRPAGEAKMQVAADLSLSLTNPSAIQVWSALAFSDVVQLGETSLFQITADSLRRARGAGFRSEQVVQFLSRQGEGLSGADLAARLATVEAAAQGLDLGLAISIECNGEEQASAVLLLVESQSYAAIRIRTTVYVVIGVRRSAVADRERIEAALDAAGLGPITNHIRW